ncbi:MAG: sulfatase-like hydrolase/transferase [Pirellulaceae bacterium]
MKPTLLLGLAWLALLAPVETPAQAADERARPHVVFLFTDDQRADTIGALGHPHMQTPHLDQLAKAGIVFRNAYCLGGNSGAVCLPSRNMLLSGRTYFRWEGPQAPATDATFPAAMKAAGYETYHHGKRGNTALHIQAQFDHNQYLMDQQERSSGEPGKVIVDRAIEFLAGRQSEQPLFMYLAFGNPHDPRLAAEKYMARYERDKLPLPKDFKPLHPFDNGDQFTRDELLAGFPRTEDEVRRHWHDYCAVITALDGHIGRLLAALKEHEMFENTLFVFSSDQGLAMGSHGLMGKQNLYNAGMQVPLIVSGPGIRAGETRALAYVHDIFPTVCDLAGVAIPEGLDGRSQRPVINGNSEGVRDSLFFAYRDVQRGIRDERYKLLRYPQVNVTQLFDLQADPHELNNLAGEAAQAERIESLTARLRAWQKELGDKAPLVVENSRDPAWNPSDPPPPKPKGKGRKKQG